ncbi:MAG: hypothetical protein HY321_09245 [Armatimonadetes bacterium]|nr:hypothetical protein [Armatimonadota bacterium]
MDLDFSAKEWRRIWEELYNSGRTDLAGRISHDLGHVWNSDDWERRMTLDFSEEEYDAITQTAEKVGIDTLW